MSLTKEMQSYLIVLILPITFLLFLLLINQKNILVSPMFISILNLTLILYALISRYFKHLIFKIYFSYHLLTMILPIFSAVFLYPEYEVNMLLRDYMIQDNDLFKSNIIILIFDLILITSVIIFYKLNLIKSKEHKLLKYYIFNDNKYLLIIFVAMFAYLMKMYLIYIGAWFMFDRSDLTQYPFANTAHVLQKLDILILLFISYNYKYDKSKLMMILMSTIMIVSLFFAIISTSKEKLFMVLIPIIMLLMQTKYKKIYLTLLTILFFSSGPLFKYLMYIRIHKSNTLVENTVNFIQDGEYSSDNKTIFDNSLLERLGYQFVFARVIKVYDTDHHEYKIDYLNNFIGLIPRFVWPDKPLIFVDGNQVGHELGVIAKNDYITSIGIRPIGEAFYQLGYFGIFIVPMIIGFILYFFSQTFQSNSWLSYLMSIMFGLVLGTKDWFNPLLPELLKMFIIFYIFGLFFSKHYIDEIKLKLKLS